MTAQPADDAVVNAPGDVFDVGFLRSSCLVEADAFVHLLEDAVDGDIVPMGVGVQTPAEVLVTRHHARLRAVDVREAVV